MERFDYYQKLLRGPLPTERVLVKKGSLLARVPPGYRTCALDERGEQLTSAAFAKRLQTHAAAGIVGVAFLIGDADGLLPDEKKGADEALALSRLTLPHQLCFVLIAEQLYRATSIQRGGKYHRD